MEWLKKHADTAIVLSAILSSFFWMNGRFNEIDKEIGHLDKEIAVIKTVLIMKNIMPADVACKDELKKD